VTCSGVSLRARPRYTLLALAISMPSRWRSRIRERSSCATAPSKCSWNVAKRRRCRVEAQALGDELDSDPAAGDLLDELGEVHNRAGEAIHRSDPDGVPAADVTQHRRQGRPVAAALTADAVGERLLHLPERSDLAGGVLLHAAHPHIPHNLTRLALAALLLQFTINGVIATDYAFTGGPHRRRRDRVRKLQLRAHHRADGQAPSHLRLSSGIGLSQTLAPPTGTQSPPQRHNRSICV